MYTFFMYLSTPEAGGGTKFNSLGFSMPATKGHAVFWPSVMSDNPDRDEPYTTHEATPVVAGRKFAANVRRRRLARPACSQATLGALASLALGAHGTGLCRSARSRRRAHHRRQGRPVAAAMPTRCRCHPPPLPPPLTSPTAAPRHLLPSQVWIHQYDYRTPAGKNCLLTHKNTH